jgi:hypothetical protein
VNTVCALEAELSSPVSVMAVDVRSLREAARDAHELLMPTSPELADPEKAELWIERVVTVLTANVASGRWACACRYEQDNSPSLSRYAHQVWIRVMAEWERVEGLRVGDSLRWTVVLRHIERKAYYWLGPDGREEWARWEAREAAAKTCADLWYWLQRNTFPFDVPFDHWAERALRNRLFGGKEGYRFFQISWRRIPGSPGPSW